ncbi:MAG: glycosyltransferase [Gilvibacter sp.]
MKILLVGEYSHLHNSLKVGLQQLGHEVTLIAAGDGFKQYPSDIPLKPVFTKGFLKKIKVLWYKIFGQDITSVSLAKEFLAHKKKLQDFDVVQLINESPLGIQPKYEREVIEFLKANNKKLFVLSCGTDYTSVKFAHDKKPRYSILNAYFDQKLTAQQAQPMLKYLSDPYETLHRFVMENCDGYIASDLDYDLPLQGHPKYLGMVPNPIVTQNFRFNTPEVIDKVVIFHGINRGAYYKKGSDLFQQALKLLNRSHGDKIDIITVESLPYQEYIMAYDRAHILLDQVYSYDQGFNALEAMAKGKVVFTGAETEFLDRYDLKDKTVAINTTPEVAKIVENLVWLVENPQEIARIGKGARAFVLAEHDAVTSAQKYLDLWA